MFYYVYGDTLRVEAEVIDVFEKEITPRESCTRMLNKWKQESLTPTRKVLIEKLREENLNAIARDVEDLPCK